MTRCASAATKSCEVPTGTPASDMKLLNLRVVQRWAERRAIKSNRAEH